MAKASASKHRSSPAREVEMKNRSSVRSVRALAPAELLFLICLLISGSVALSQPFPSFMLDNTIVRGSAGS